MRKRISVFALLLVASGVMVILSAVLFLCLGFRPVAPKGSLRMGARGEAPSHTPLPSVAVVESQITRSFLPNGEQARMDMQACFAALKDLGVSYSAIGDEDLVARKLVRYRLLLLPNVKNMSRSAVEAVNRYASGGGKILAFYMTSYRNEEDQPQPVSGDGGLRKIIRNNFQLADLFGADFARWSGYPPSCQILSLQPPDPTTLSSSFDSQLQAGVGKKVELGRNMAMLVRPREGSLVLATWLNKDGSVTSPWPAAIVLNRERSCLYVGEDLLAPENCSAPRVRRLLGNLMNLLSPGIASPEQVKEKREPSAALREVPAFPDIQAARPEGKILDVALTGEFHEGYLRSSSGLELFRETGKGMVKIGEAERGSLLKIRAARGGIEVENLGMSGGIPGPAMVSGSREKSVQELFARPVVFGGIVEFFEIRSSGAYHRKVVRGGVIFHSTGSRSMAVINRTDLNWYLAGVVPTEVPFHFRLEALKSMAIIGRTFALGHMGRHKNEGYDLCSTVHCQAYGGVPAEVSPPTEAISDTAGEVLTYQGKLADTPFHSTCGGVTADIQEAWNLPAQPYLVAVSDTGQPWEAASLQRLQNEDAVREFLDHPPPSYCDHSSRFRWVEVFSREELERIFAQSLPKVLAQDGRGGAGEAFSFGHLQDLQVKERTLHGRVKLLEITTSTGTYPVSQDKLRWLFSGGNIGTGGLQSTFFYVAKEVTPQQQAAEFRFVGGGWGHGVGMCQFGAQGMGKKGFPYQEILTHYYPGTRVEKEGGQ